MPVMKQFRIGSATYDTVGEASVTQVQTSGTKIATVTIDGTATDLYAPEGGSVTMEDTAVDAAVDEATYLTNGSSVTITNNAPSYITINKTTVEDYSPFVVTCGSTDGVVNFSSAVYTTTTSVGNGITQSPVTANTEYVFLSASTSFTVSFTTGGGGGND